MVKSTIQRDEFIEKNLALVHSICKRFVGRGIEYDDLYQVGCVGLIKAVDAFEAERGLMFSTYAVPVIMGEIRRLFRDGGAVKVSRSVKELYLRISRERPKLEANLGREAAVSELAEYLGVSAEDITEAVCAAQPTVSLTVEDDDGVKELQIPSVDESESVLTGIDISAAFSELSDKEKQIVRLRYYKFLTQSKTAQLLGMTQVQVSRAEKKILLKLRNLLEP